MLFKNIKGHDRAISFLKSSISSGRIANAYVFCGKEGIGKKSMAIAFAEAVNCLVSPGEGCGTCPSCVKIEHLNHPDVRVISPEKEGQSVKIADIRSLITDTGLKPYEAVRKIYIVDQADDLTEEASGALLKTLEEPSADSTIILISESPSRLLPTIRSRCQVVKMLPLDARTVEGILVASHGLEKSRAHVLAMISCGSLATALKLNDDNFFDKRERVIVALSNGRFLDMDLDKTSKPDLRSILNIMLTWYRDILVIKTASGGLINIDKKEMVGSASRRYSIDKINTAVKKIISTQYYLEMSANPKLAMTALGIAL